MYGLLSRQPGFTLAGLVSIFDPSMGLFPNPHPNLGVLRAGGSAHPSLLALTPGVRPLEAP